MFEQHLYDAETPRRPESGDLFYNYEIRNWDLTPRIYKIVAASVILNLLAVFVIGQTNMLTMKGCESPFVGRVCQVLDTVYVSALLFGTERDFVDVTYDRVDLGDAEVVWLDRTGDMGPFTYPEGYFQIANPEKFTAPDPSANPTLNYIAPGIPSVNAGGDLFSRKPNLPSPNPDSVRGQIPTSPFAIEGGDENPTIDANSNRGRGGRIPTDPKNANSNIDQQVADANTNANTGNPTVVPTGPVEGIEINKRPMADLGDFVNDLREKKQVNLASSFSVNAKGKLNKEGRFDPKSFRFVQASSTDAKLVDVVKEAIEAINVAGYLQYLEMLSGKDLAIAIQQDDVNISSVVESEMESETRARSVKTLIELAITEAKNKKSGEDADQNDKDDLVLLEGLKVETEGKKVVIRFLGPKAVVHPMIERKLEERAAEAKKPTGNAVTGQDDKSSAR